MSHILLQGLVEVTGGPVQPVDVWGGDGYPLSSQLMMTLSSHLMYSMNRALLLGLEETMASCSAS
jgi:hypothetical protein